MKPYSVTLLLASKWMTQSKVLFWSAFVTSMLSRWKLVLSALRARPEKGLSGRALRDSEGLLKPAWNRDVDPSHSAAA